jgi:hypothetical protein
MQKNRDYLTITIMVLAVLLLISGGIYIGKTFFDGKKEPVDEDPVVVETTVNVVLKDATVFRFDELDFQFVLAQLEVTSNKPLDIGLEMFSTNEGIALSKVAFYMDKLKEMGFSLDKFNVADSFVSEAKTLKKYVFIPVMDKGATVSTLTVNLNKAITIPLDLSIATGTKDQVGLIQSDVITDKTSYRITLGPIVEINGMPMQFTTPSGDASLVDFSDVSTMFAVQFTIESMGGSAVGLENAKFMIDKSPLIANAMVKVYSVDNHPNFIEQKFTKQTTGYFYLQLNSTTETILNRNGTMMLKLFGMQNWITVFYIH